MRRQLLAALERFGLLRGLFRGYETLKSLRPFRPALDSDGLPLPPARLRVRVAGTAEPGWFLESGRLTAAAVEDAISRRGVEVEKVKSLLDFGCGCGRVIRNWKALGSVDLHGCDRDAELVRWCAKNLPFAQFAVQGAAPPLPYAAASFRVACAVSVFTHLPPDDQRTWLEELRRVLTPAGLLVITTHGDRYVDRLDSAERAEFDSGNLVVRWESAAGTNLCTAFHPLEYVREQLAAGFELVEHIPAGAAGTPFQDLVVLRRPPTSADQRPSRATAPRTSAPG